MEKERRLLFDMITYTGEKIYKELHWWNFLERYKQKAILKFLRRTINNL